ncbi:MAG: NADH-quinone oxidoreductase subunit M [Magnetococcales bacterium]|nr:NADH-quinone oxidoreductase subunit M [Magnetococcales bacterium]
MVNNPPLLSALLLIPPLGALLIWLVRDPAKARMVALFTGILNLAIALRVLVLFDGSISGFQFVERTSWIPTLHVDYHLGVDGISILFLPLAALLFVGVILASWTRVRNMPRLFFTLLLFLESLTLGVFCAIDVILFYLFWELTLIPIYFLISLWGIGPYRRHAATKYILFMLVGGVPLLVAFVYLAIHQAEAASGVAQGLTFSYPALFANPIASELQTALFFLLLLGFAAKTPLFPLHTWLPTLTMEGHTSLATLMVGLKIGAYGLMRYLLPLAPDAAREYHWLLAGLGIIGLLYGALAALAQTNIRRMLAYGSMSHVGLVVLGLASLDQAGVQGALFQLLNFTVVAGGLFLLTGFLRHRTGSTDLLSLGGGVKTMPLLVAFFFWMGIASLGVPGTSGFPAEFLILVSALGSHTGAGLAALAAMVLGAAYFLSFFQKSFLGPVKSSLVAQAVDLRPRELVVAVTLGGVILLFGLFPSLVLDLTRESTALWVSHIGAVTP